MSTNSLQPVPDKVSGESSDRRQRMNYHRGFVLLPLTVYCICLSAMLVDSVGFRPGDKECSWTKKQKGDRVPS